MYILYINYKVLVIGSREDLRISTLLIVDGTRRVIRERIIITNNRVDNDASAEFVIFIDGCCTFITSFHTAKPEKRVAGHGNTII